MSTCELAEETVVRRILVRQRLVSLYLTYSVLNSHAEAHVDQLVINIAGKNAQLQASQEHCSGS